MVRRSAAVLVLSLVWLAGCAKGADAPVAGDAAGDESPVALEAATIAGIYDEPVRLQEGRYEGPPFVPGGASRPRVTLLPEHTTVADLDSDGVRDWLVVLAESSGGSGTFYYLSVMQPVDLEFRSRATVLIGDRVEIERIAVEGTTVRVDLLGSADEDPASFRGVSRARRWQWVEDDLHPLARFAGRLVYGHESRELITCDGRRYWVADASGGDLRRLYEAMTREPYQPRFVEVSGVRLPAPRAGFASDHEEQVRVTALLRMEVEGPGCALDLAGARFRASGVEPFWHVDVHSDRLSFAGLGRKPVVAEIETREVERATRVWRGRTDAGELVLTLEERRCTNPMSGSVFAYTAELRSGAEAFSGCALAPLPSPSQP